jgi:hypothetical protein
MTCNWYTIYVQNVKQKILEGVYMDKRREYNYNLVRNSQNILYIRSVKRSKNLGLDQGHIAARLTNAISIVTTISTRFCSLVCKIHLFSLLLPT